MNDYVLVFSTYTSTPTPIPVIEYKEQFWECPTCTPAEQYVLKELQKQTNIKSRNAFRRFLETLNRKVTSVPSYARRGSRVPYDRCFASRWIYGIIQWTTESRYNGLGSFCKKYGCDPSSLAGQVRYMINENQFQTVLPEFEGGVDTVAQYMVPCYYWIRLGNQR